MTMVDQLGDALQTAHRSGVVHGDIKPDNVLLDDEGNAYLSDFGIAVGARAMSTGLGHLRPRRLVAEALTGRERRVDELRGALPDRVARVIDRATGVDAAGRYESVDDLVDDLHEALGGDDGSHGLPIAARVERRRRQSVQGAASVRRRRRRRLLRSRAARRTADRAARRQRHPRAVHRRGRSERQRQVERGEGAGCSPRSGAGRVPLSGSWFTIEMTPAPHPFEQLEDALLGVAVDPPPSLLEQLAGDQGMQRALDRVLPDDGSQLLLLIDQFEELFTQVDTATANRFIASLVSAVTDDRRVASVSSPRFEPTSTTGRCSTAVSVNCSATGPRSSRR